jgi:hypothetical protein
MHVWKLKNKSTYLSASPTGVMLKGFNQLNDTSLVGRIIYHNTSSSFLNCLMQCSMMQDCRSVTYPGVGPDGLFDCRYSPAHSSHYLVLQTPAWTVWETVTFW